MKARTLIALTALGALVSACNEQVPTPKHDYALAVMVDQTDTLALYPTSKAILAPLDLDANPCRGVCIQVVGINAEDITQRQTLALENENPYTSNRIIRAAKVNHFESQLQACLDGFHRTRSAPHSIIFRAIAKEAMALRQNPAPHKIILVYSDLLEHSNVDFYNPETRAELQRSPGMVERQLCGSSPFTDLGGMEAFFLYAPRSYEENGVYMSVARLYEHTYTAHHAVVHVGNQFVLP